MNELVSVIIPVYNVERYLERCVQSITQQTYKSLEIILVNDGSTDNCGRMCDEIALKDSRVKVIHKENGGLSSARNAGLDVATGAYVAFVDSDDWIATDIYDKCIKAMNDYSSDVVDFRAAFVTSAKVPDVSDYYAPVVVEGQKILTDYLYRGQTEKSPFSVWRKVYRHTLYDNVRFPEGKVNEDIATNFRVLQNSNRLVHISDVGYYYFQGNQGSITSGMLKKKDFDLLDASKELCELAAETKYSEIQKLAEIKLARSYFSLLAKAATGGTSEDIKKKDIHYLTKELRKKYLLLMRSPMPVNRKICTTLVCLDYRTLAIPYRIFRGAQKNRMLT